MFLLDKKNLFVDNNKEKTSDYNYFQDIYIKEAILMYNFIKRKNDVPVHLSVYTRSVDFSNVSTNWKLNARFLDELFIRICKALGEDDTQYIVSGKYHYHFMVLRNTGDDSEYNLLGRVEKLRKRTREGKRTYSYTTYDAAAVGLNLLLPVCDCYQNNLVKLNDFSFGHNNFNINSIYLDKITNFIPCFEKVDDEAKELEAKMDRAFVATRLCNVTGEIKQNDIYKYSTARKVSISNLSSFYHYMLERLIQAIGRIDRTSTALNFLSIYIDENIKIPKYIFEEWNQEDFSDIFKLVKEQIVDNNATDISTENYLCCLENRLNRGASTMKAILNPGSYNIEKIIDAEKLNRFINKHIFTKSDSPFLDGAIPVEYAHLYINVRELERHKLKLESIKYNCVESSRGARFTITTNEGKNFAFKSFTNPLDSCTQKCEEAVLMELKDEFQLEDMSSINYILNPIFTPKIIGNFGEAVVKIFFNKMGYELYKTFDFKGFNKNVSDIDINDEIHLKYKTYEQFDFYFKNSEQIIPVEIKNYRHKVSSIEQVDDFYEKYYQRMEEFGLNKMILINTFAKDSGETVCSIKKDDIYPNCKILVVPGVIKSGTWNKSVIREIDKFIK